MQCMVLKSFHQQFHYIQELDFCKFQEILMKKVYPNKKVQLLKFQSPLIKFNPKYCLHSYLLIYEV